MKLYFSVKLIFLLISDNSIITSSYPERYTGDLFILNKSRCHLMMSQLRTTTSQSYTQSTTSLTLWCDTTRAQWRLFQTMDIFCISVTWKQNTHAHHASFKDVCFARVFVWNQVSSTESPHSYINEKRRDCPYEFENKLWSKLIWYYGVTLMSPLSINLHIKQHILTFPLYSNLWPNCWVNKKQTNKQTNKNTKTKTKNKQTNKQTKTKQNKNKPFQSCTGLLTSNAINRTKSTLF